MLFAGWDSVAQFYELSGTPRFKECGKVKELIDGVEDGHARNIELEMVW